MTTAPITLTDRYVAALKRQLPLRPLRRRQDIEVELRALIEDEIEDRVGAGSTLADAELDTITQLGDPTRLAVGYSDRPQALLGPALFPDYRRLIGILLSTVIPGVAIMLIATQLLAGISWPELLGTTAVIVATLTMHVLFWTTLAFAIVERVPRIRAIATAAWEPSALPETEAESEGLGETILGIAFILGFIALIVVSPTLTGATDSAGNPVGVLSPALWENWSAAIIVILVVAAVFGLATEYLGWTLRLAIVNAVLTVIGTAILVALVANQLLFNPLFFESIGWSSGAPVIIGWVLVGFGVLNGIREIVGGFTRAARRKLVTR